MNTNIAQAAGSATLTVKVTRASGEVEEFAGTPVNISTEQLELLTEYQQIINRAREIEIELFGYPISGE